MTDQEFFDQTVNHLLTQGRKALNASGFCAMRDEQGLKCALGYWIPDNEYTFFHEGKSVHALLTSSFCSLTLRKIIRPRATLAYNLQSIHDHSDPGEWYIQLYNLAGKHHLSTESLRSRWAAKLGYDEVPKI